MKPLAFLLSFVVLCMGCSHVVPVQPADTQLSLADVSPASATLPEAPPAASPVQTAASELQVGRYTTLAALPSEADADPLAVVAQVHFPRGVVATVEDAVRYLLLRTGYQLTPAEQLDPRVKGVLGMRLPDNQRVLGPYRVDAMLGVLLGTPFRLSTDPATRTVTYLPPSQGGTPAASPVAAARRAQPTRVVMQGAATSGQQGER